MPYARAQYYLLAVIGVILVGFWPTYFSVLGTVPWQFHAHGLASSAWIIVVTTQCWTATTRRLPLHRLIGKVSLLLFPILTAGLAAIVDATAKGYVAGDDSFRVVYGGSLLMIVMVAMAAYVTLYYRALKFRRSVWVHAGYLLSTPLILFESAFHRVMLWYVPGLLAASGPDGEMLLPGISIAMSVELVIIAVIWAKFRDRAKPFLVAAVFIVAQMLAMTLLKNSILATWMLRLIGHLPSAIVMATGFTIGALTSLAGWNDGKRPALSASRNAQPA
ncbi:hypothetical protein ABDK56_10090 [Sphingomonas sp. ASV193]|uniref:hypothetical protein n=1 Tax=Sphingomonas sp. ASV193 TaxID=3144405 RepID=UPI0032E853D1